MKGDNLRGDLFNEFLDLSSANCTLMRFRHSWIEDVGQLLPVDLKHDGLSEPAEAEEDGRNLRRFESCRTGPLPPSPETL